jgi:gluconolactonase
MQNQIYLFGFFGNVGDVDNYKGLRPRLRAGANLFEIGLTLVTTKIFHMKFFPDAIMLVSLNCAVMTVFGQQPAAQQAFFDADSITAGSSGLRLLSHQFSFTEGASVDRSGNVFFTDQPNNKIWEYSTEGKLTLFLDSAGRSNGMYFDAEGNLITCADEQDELWSISPQKKITVLVNNFQGHRLNGPNDLWIDGYGGIYFTDPYYQRPYWNRTHTDLDGEKVYYLPSGKKEPRVVAEGLMQPNGIVGTPDGGFLYVADIKDNKTYKYRIQSDGNLSDRQLFVMQGSDGMTLDEKGDLYLTGDGVTVYDPTGKEIAHIPVPAKWTANLCLGGMDKRELFITASEGLYVLPMRVRGVE